jgi:hypothetical protein
MRQQYRNVEENMAIRELFGEVVTEGGKHDRVDTWLSTNRA